MDTENAVAIGHAADVGCLPVGSRITGIDHLPVIHRDQSDRYPFHFRIDRRLDHPCCPCTDLVDGLLRHFLRSHSTYSRLAE